MEAKGVKGLKDVQYDPNMMGQYILENLVGFAEMKKLSRPQQATYVKEAYPKVMAFFEMHDLQPTLMNLRLNLDAIKHFAENFGVDKEATTKEVVSFAGPEMEPPVVKPAPSLEECTTVLMLVGVMACIFFIIK